MRKSLNILVFSAVIVVLFISMMVIAAASSNNATKISADSDLMTKSKDTVRSFSGAPGSVVSFIKENKYSGKQVNEFRSKEGDFFINNTGTVEYAYFNNKWQNSKDVKLDLTQAKSIAISYAKKQDPKCNIDNMNLIHEQLVDTGIAKQYEFTWNEMINGVYTPNLIAISVNPNTGEIISYSNIHRDITVSLTPKIERDIALTSTIEQLKGFNVETSNATMRIVYPSGSDTQKLVWVVALTGNVDNNSELHYGIVMIDATSGEVMLDGTY